MIIQTLTYSCDVKGCHTQKVVTTSEVKGYFERPYRPVYWASIEGHGIYCPDHAQAIVKALEKVTLK